MLSHMPHSPFASQFNPAVSAVIMFYFISGRLMYYSFEKVTRIKDLFSKQVIDFYLKRVLRLFPLYLIVLFATITILWIFGPSQSIPLLNQEPTFSKTLLNSVMIFNNYVFDPFVIHTLLPHPLVPPTWSLSTEWHFYLLVPFLYILLKKHPGYFLAILLGSLFFQWIAFAINTPHFNSNNFGYRYIFGVLWIFMFGFVSVSHPRIFKGIYLLIVVYFMFIGFYFTSRHVFVKEILLALLFLPLIDTIIQHNFKYDNIFGRLSYPLFLVHFFVFLLVEKFFGYRNPWLYFFLVFTLALVLAHILAKIQARVYRPQKWHLNPPNA